MRFRNIQRPPRVDLPMTQGGSWLALHPACPKMCAHHGDAIDLFKLAIFHSP
jgi:hypothetical protein